MCSCEEQEEENMGKDIGWKGFLSDDERYADVINGIGCKGEQVVKKEDLQELDTQTGFLHGPKSLHEMLDFTDIPETLREMVADYKINLVEIRKLEDTSVFKTDVRQVFDFIRCSNDKNALKKLVETDDYYKNMEEDAFDVAVQYTNATELIEAKEYYEKEGAVDMCKALTELIEDGRNEGKDEKLRELVVKKVKKGLSVSEIADVLEEDEETIGKIIESLK